MSHDPLHQPSRLWKGFFFAISGLMLAIWASLIHFGDDVLKVVMRGTIALPKAASHLDEIAPALRESVEQAAKAPLALRAPTPKMTSAIEDFAPGVRPQSARSFDIPAPSKVTSVAPAATSNLERAGVNRFPELIGAVKKSSKLRGKIKAMQVPEPAKNALAQLYLRWELNNKKLRQAQDPAWHSQAPYSDRQREISRLLQEQQAIEAEVSRMAKLYG